jgi:cysteine protease ATG4
MSKSAITNITQPDKNKHTLSNSPLWLLGTQYNDNNNSKAKLFNIMASKFLFTYRYDFEYIGSTSYSSDVGWGCCLRSMQMLLAEANCRLTFGKDYIFNHILSDTKDQYSKYLNIIKLFEDTSKSGALFSLHNILLTNSVQAESMLSKMSSYLSSISSIASKVSNSASNSATSVNESKIGQWVGPFQASKMVKKTSDANNNNNSSSCNIYISPDNTVYLDELTIMVNQKPTIILIPIRVGDQLNKEYLPSLVATFKLNQSLGIVGGSGNSSYYIIGYQDDRLIIMDPHQVQKSALIDNMENMSEIKEVCTTYHTPELSSIGINDLDPSLALGFLIKDKGDLDNWLSNIPHFEQNVFYVSKTSPKYDVDPDILFEDDE